MGALSLWHVVWSPEHSVTVTPPVSADKLCVPGDFLRSRDTTMNKLGHFLLKGGWPVREECVRQG